MNPNSDIERMFNESQILLYRAEDDKTQIQVKLQDETVWLTQAQMAELFQKDVRTINEHVQNLYEEGELEKGATIRNFRIVQTEGKRQLTRSIDFTTSTLLSPSAIASSRIGERSFALNSK